ncbi:MAG: hypothetical protein ACLR0N_13025 [Bilophila wadsworthia]
MVEPVRRADVNASSDRRWSRFPRTIFHLQGQADLEQISADTSQDKPAVLLPGQGPHAQERHFVPQGQLPIIPGMVTTVDILTGKKTVLDYILKPILKARQNALRER